MIWQLILITALVIEAFTIFGRFFFKLSSKEVLTRIMHHYGWRRVFHFHHLFFGLIVVGVAIYLKSDVGISLGWGIALSDVIHHFITLWIIIGDPEFHLIYRNAKLLKKEEKMEDRRIRKFLRRNFSWF